MLLPSIFDTDLLNGFFSFPYSGAKKDVRSFPEQWNPAMMKTDVRENDERYIVDMDLPGFAREDVQASLENGYLTVTAEKHSEETTEEKESGKFIRKERYVGSLRRSFYVGDEVTDEDITASFANGVLSLGIAKKKEQPKQEEKKLIPIAG